MKFYNYVYRKFLEEDEVIEQVIHHNYDELIKPIFIQFFIFIAFPIFAWANTEHLSFLWLGIIIIGLFKSINLFLYWLFNSLMVTNLNIVDNKWISFFQRASERIDYSQIESFSYEINGVINTIFNIGDIHITKLSGEEYLLKGIYKPQFFCNRLNHIQIKKAKEEIYKDHTQLKDILTTVVQKHIAEHGITVTND
ncbi:hypothetical protein HOJ01_02885 [bacterium]|jgi:hypothetical protein|nr:hypothetical protein [bacterium]MBT6293729.1 hypothetical protein [bacterium]